MKSLGVYYWYVKMPWCVCVERGLEYIILYVKKHIALLAACSGPPTGSWQTFRGAHICETHLLPFMVLHGTIVMLEYYWHEGISSNHADLQIILPGGITSTFKWKVLNGLLNL